MSASNTLRLLIPQWQGGNNPAYHFGAQLLAWLAPTAKGPVAEIAVNQPGQPLELQNGIVGRSALVRQIETTAATIEQHNPDKLVILGGDCLVDLAPFAYLAKRYQQRLGVLWIDAHPDIMTPEQFSHAHAMVLRALMGEGDEELASFVKTPVSSHQIFYAGVNNESDYEADFIKTRNIRVSRPDAIRNGEFETALQQWIQEEGITCLAIHLDLDVLNIRDFGSLLFNKPDAPADAFAGIAQGQLGIADVLRVITFASQQADVVGLGIAEHLPWDSLNLRNLLAELPLLKD